MTTLQTLPLKKCLSFESSDTTLRPCVIMLCVCCVLCVVCCVCVVCACVVCVCCVCCVCVCARVRVCTRVCSNPSTTTTPRHRSFVHHPHHLCFCCGVQMLEVGKIAKSPAVANMFRALLAESEELHQQHSPFVADLCMTLLAGELPDGRFGYDSHDATTPGMWPTAASRYASTTRHRTADPSRAAGSDDDDGATESKAAVVESRRQTAANRYSGAAAGVQLTDLDLTGDESKGDEDTAALDTTQFLIVFVTGGISPAEVRVDTHSSVPRGAASGCCVGVLPRTCMCMGYIAPFFFFPFLVSGQLHTTLVLLCSATHVPACCLLMHAWWSVSRCVLWKT